MLMTLGSSTILVVRVYTTNTHRHTHVMRVQTQRVSQQVLYLYTVLVHILHTSIFRPSRARTHRVATYRSTGRPRRKRDFQDNPNTSGNNKADIEPLLKIRRARVGGDTKLEMQAGITFLTILLHSLLATLSNEVTRVTFC